jgi:hypothetical protein
MGRRRRRRTRLVWETHEKHPRARLILAVFCLPCAHSFRLLQLRLFLKGFFCCIFSVAVRPFSLSSFS